MYAGGVVGSVPWFIQANKLSLTLTLTCEGSCSKYNWDPWTPCIALHASQNVVECLKCLETIQVIEYSAAINACKKSNNSYSNYIDHKLQQCSSGGVQNLHTFSTARRWSFTPALVHDIIMQVNHWSFRVFLINAHMSRDDWSLTLPHGAICDIAQQ